VVSPADAALAAAISLAADPQLATGGFSCSALKLEAGASAKALE